MESGGEFGHFALDFEIDTLKRLDAMPLFSVTRAGAGVGTLVEISIAMLASAAVTVSTAQRDRECNGP
jgi:hypothetical protein